MNYYSIMLKKIFPSVIISISSLSAATNDSEVKTVDPKKVSSTEAIYERNNRRDRARAWMRRTDVAAAEEQLKQATTQINDFIEKLKESYTRILDEKINDAKESIMAAEFNYNDPMDSGRTREEWANDIKWSKLHYKELIEIEQNSQEHFKKLEKIANNFSSIWIKYYMAKSLLDNLAGDLPPEEYLSSLKTEITDAYYDTKHEVLETGKKNITMQINTIIDLMPERIKTELFRLYTFKLQYVILPETSKAKTAALATLPE